MRGEGGRRPGEAFLTASSQVLSVTATCTFQIQVVPTMSAERRMHRRIQLRTPVRGVVGPSLVFMTDGSVGGMGIAHQGELPPPGGICRLDLVSDWGPIRVDCQVVRTVQTRTERPVYHSGLHIVVMDHQSAQRLQTMIEGLAEDDF